MIVEQQNYAEGGDILLRSGNETFLVHKLILSLSSKIFKDLIETSKPSTNENVRIVNNYSIDEIYVHGETPELIRGMLSFIYPDKYHITITWDNISDYLRISNKFAIKKLEQGCKEMLLEKIQINTLLTMKFAEEYSFHDIYKESSKLILDDFLIYSSDSQFKQLSKETRLKLHERWSDYQNELQQFICKYQQVKVHRDSEIISLRKYITEMFPSTTLLKLLKPSLLVDMCEKLLFVGYYNKFINNYPQKILTYEPLFQNVSLTDKKYIFIELDD
ncbi:hypothetical protein RclHR1_00170026 [Rhizophagus clarus]|uniref:BTB/POZ domain-containing protein n=1 Tax=Rhizophagus clarus TaxID=94130 RepID=A0A2Z6QN29_9GLOM|nr:hypothetical protein RclHR1_00170026 [Rhizophagus clarus]GET00920.1 BTB/POZ domain-containing protein [Rhizophagus clarus]